MAAGWVGRHRRCRDRHEKGAAAFTAKETATFGSDFAWLNFDNAFDQPNEEATRGFVVDELPVSAAQDGSPVGAEGFIIVQARDVGNSSTAEGDEITHRILINGQHLPSFDMVAHRGWNLWMDRIPEGFLQHGRNRLTIRRRAVDGFVVANVVVQWRERRASGTVLSPAAAAAAPLAG